MIDCFSDMFKLQKKFTEEFFEKTHNIDIKALFCDKEELGKHSREYILAAINKCSELVKDMNWKISADRISMNEDVDSNFKEHCIDVFKYILGLMIIHGMDEKQIYDEFIEKSIVVSEKFRQNNAIITWPIIINYDVAKIQTNPIKKKQSNFHSVMPRPQHYTNMISLKQRALLKM